MARPVAGLARLVGRVPRLLVLLLIGVTVVMAGLSGQSRQDTQGEQMMPDVPEAAAADMLDDRFGDAGEQVVQVLVRSTHSGLVSADGHAAAAAIERAVRSSDAADRLADVDGRPAVVSWMFPAQQALAELPADAVDDDQVESAYAAALGQLPAGHADMAAALLPEGSDPATADTALTLVFLDESGLATDPEARMEQTRALHASIADVVAEVDLPAGFTAEPFSLALMFADAEAGFEAELGRLFSAAFAIIMLILAFVYWVRPGRAFSRLRSGRRTLADLLVSMATTVMAIVWMMGAAVLLGPDYLGVVGPMTEFGQIIPILLIGLGVDYAIHLTSRYREEIGNGVSTIRAVSRSVTTVGGALVLATLTTAVGFLTNVFNPIPALQDFGILAAVGIASAFVLMLTFVPAVRLLLDRRAEAAGRLPAGALASSSDRALPGLMGRAAVLADRAPVATIAVTVLLAGLGLFGMSNLETRFSQTDFVPDDTPALATLTTLTEDFAGGYGDTTDLLVTGEVTDPAVHNALVAAHVELAEVDDVVAHGGMAQATSPVTVLAGLLADGPDAAPVGVAAAAERAGVTDQLAVADDADVAGLYAAMATAAPDAMGQVLAHGPDGTAEAVRVQVMTTADEADMPSLMATLEQVFAPVEAAGAEVVATSPAIQNQVVVDALRDSQATSLAIALLAAMLLLVAVFAYEQRRPALGVLTIVPVVLVVLWTFGMMAATGIPFGPITATIAALAIGIGLPYAIHVTHRFTEDRARHPDAGTAIRATVRHTGGAMAGSAFTTIAGFGILVTSSLPPFRQLGAVTVYAVGFSLLAATLVLPSLLVLWDRWHQRRSRVARLSRGRLVRRVATATLATVVVAGAGSAAWADQSASAVRSADSDRIDALVADRMQAHGIPGASVAVVRAGRTVHLAGYGTADPDGTPVTADTPFLIGSASKPVTAMAVRQLIADGQLSLDEPVLPHLAGVVDEFPDGFEQVTVEQLLAHTAGLSMANGLAGTVPIHRGPDALDRRVAELLAQPLVRPPGQQHEYSNAGPMLLAAVVEQVTDQPFADHLDQVVFGPLGMDDSFGTDTHPAADRLATGHALWFGRWRPAAQPYDPAGVAMGYVGSTARDLARFLHAHLPTDSDPAVVPVTAAAIAAEPTVPTGWDDVPLEGAHGLGWFVDDLDGHRVVSHSGSLGTFTTHLVMVPGADGLGIAVQTNASAFIAAGHEAQYDLSLELTRLLLDLEPGPADRDVLLSLVAPAVAWLAAMGILGGAARWLTVTRHRQHRRAAGATGWWRRWGRPVVAPALGYALLAATIVAAVPLQAARHFYPDAGWGLTVTAVLAAGWAMVRTVVALRTVAVGHQTTAGLAGAPARAPQEVSA